MIRGLPTVKTRSERQASERSSRTAIASRLAGIVEYRDPALGMAVVHHLDEVFVYRHSGILTDEHVGFDQLPPTVPAVRLVCS